MYDADIVGDFSLPAARLATVKAPPWPPGARPRGSDAVADALPDARRRTLEGQPHKVDVAALAPVLAEFLAA